MQIVYSQQEIPESFTKSIFLSGPTARSKDVKSWRIEALEILKKIKYNGVVFVPEFENPPEKFDYEDQIEWEEKAINCSDRILMWVPRNMETLPGLTTNCEFGELFQSGKLIYGRPDNAVSIRYLDEKYKKFYNRDPESNLEKLMINGNLLQDKIKRIHGERNIPIDLFLTKSFVSWYNKTIKQQGNKLEEAKVLWNFRVGENKEFIFAYSIWCKIWIDEENRYKENEFILGRNNISTVVLYSKAKHILQTKIVLIKEFRSTVNNTEGYVYELPGGSSFDNDASPNETAVSEVEEETGLVINPNRIEWVNTRQLVATFSNHSCSVYKVELTDKELEIAEKREKSKKTFGNQKDSELTYIKVLELKEIIENDYVDYSNLGMIFESLKD